MNAAEEIFCYSIIETITSTTHTAHNVMDLVALGTSLQDLCTTPKNFAVVTGKRFPDETYHGFFVRSEALLLL